MRHSLTLFITALVLSACLMPAQASDEKKYNELATALRQQVWSDNTPEFHNYNCPEEYLTGHSAVILASSTDVEFTRKSYIKMRGWLQFGNVKKLGRHELTRMLIKLNDAAAIKKFSEFDYFTFKKSYNYDLKETEQQVLGVRVIKPGGKIVEVSTDEYMATREGKKGDEVSYKLAVPGLEVGDIIDLFTYEEKIVQQRNTEPIIFSFVADYPMLYYKAKCTIDDKLTAQYRTFNGAPDFKVSTDKDKNTILEAEVRNVEAVAPHSWYSPIDQAPMIKLYAFDKSLTNKELKSIRKGERLQSNPDYRAILLDCFNMIKFTKDYYKYSDIRDAHKFIGDDVEAARKATDKRAAARHLYNSVVYYYMGFDKFDRYCPENFIATLSFMLEQSRIPFYYVVTTASDKEPLDKLIYYENATWVLMTTDGDFFTAPQYKCQTAGTLPAELQGRLAAVTAKLDGDKTNYTLETLPQDNYNINNNLARIDATIDGMTIDVNRTETLKGTTKETFSAMISGKQMIEDYDRLLHRKKTYLEEISKKERKAVEEQFEKEKESQLELFKSEAEFCHDIKPKQYIGYNILSTGLDPQSPQYVYDTHYTLDGLVKKAGNNLVVSVGKLLGNQLSVEGEERKRDCDIYRDSPKSFDTIIYLSLPSGYTITGDNLDKLNVDVKNEAAAFKVTPSLEGDKLHLLVQKTYYKAHYPQSQWQDLLKVIDAASDFTNRQIVIKK